MITDDCIKNGKDYHASGARYNTSYLQGVGLGSITDMFSAVKTHVFEKRSSVWASSWRLWQIISPMNACGSCFQPHTRLAAMMTGADEIAIRVFESYWRSVDGRPTPHGAYRINMLPTTCHIYFGSVMIASPDGSCYSMPL